MNEQVFEPKSQKWDELKSEWVTFPDGNKYLLPVILRTQKIKPHFAADGSVSVTVETNDRELAKLVDDFAEFVRRVQDEQAPAGEEEMVTIFSLARKLLQSNYSFSDEEVADILTVTNRQFRDLVAVLTEHLPIS